MTPSATTSSLKMRIAATAVALASISAAPRVFAQDGEVAEAATELTLMSLIGQGGWAMWPLGLLSIAVITLIVYNALQLTKGKFAPADLQAAVHEQMAACRVRSAIEVSATSPTYLGRMLTTSLPRVDATDPETLGQEAVEDEMADFTVKENRSYLTWIGYFSIISQVAPMVGLLGTVSGMIKAFAKLQSGGGANPEALAGNISEALVTTATGLIVAIPALFGYFVFKNRLNKLVAECHAAENDMLEASIMAVNADQYMAKVPEGLQAG